MSTFFDIDIADYRPQFPLVHPNISHPYGNVSKWGEPPFFFLKKVAFLVSKRARLILRRPHIAQRSLQAWVRDWGIGLD